MAEKYRHRNHTVVGVRIDDPALRDDAREAAKAAGYGDLSAATVAFWAWLARRPGARQPQRPDTAPGQAAYLLIQLARTVADLEESDPDAAKRIMGEVSTFGTDWWGTHR